MASMNDFEYVYCEYNDVTIAGGERISVKILNADNTLKTQVMDDDVPTGKTFTGRICVSGYFPPDA